MAQGHEAVPVFDLHMARAADSAIWQHAKETSAVIVTKDEDFAVFAQLASPGPPVIWIRVGNTRRAELMSRLASMWPGVVEALSRGESLVELT